MFSNFEIYQIEKKIATQVIPMNNTNESAKFIDKFSFFFWLVLLFNFLILKVQIVIEKAHAILIFLWPQ